MSRGSGQLDPACLFLVSSSGTVVFLRPWYRVGSEFFCFLLRGQAVGFVEVGWPDRARLHLGGGGRRWRARIRGLQRSGRVPGRWATADGDFCCDSFKSQGAMGPRQLTVKIGFFLDGDSWRRRGRRQGFHEGSRGFFVISLLVRVLCEVWLYQLPLYHVRLCMRTSTCTFSLSKNTYTYYKKKVANRTVARRVSQRRAYKSGALRRVSLHHHRSPRTRFGAVRFPSWWPCC